MKPKRNDKKGKQQIATTIQQNQDSESEEEETVTTAVFSQGKPIDLRSDSGDEMKLVAFGKMVEGVIDLGFDSSDETKISTDSVPKKKRTLTVVEFQELEENNQGIQAKMLS